MPFKLYVVQYDHRHGTDAFIVRSSRPPTEEQVVAALDLDFEPHRNESILINEADRIVTIKQ